MNRVHRAFDAWRGRASAGVSAAASALANAPENAAYGLLAMAPLGAALAPQAMMLTLVGVVLANATASLAGGGHLVGGARAALALLTAGLVAALAARLGPVAPGAVLGLVALGIACAGLLQVLFGWLKLGQVVKFTPHPVRVGLTSGIGLLLMGTALPVMLGSAFGTGIVEALPRAQPGAVGIGILAVAVAWLTQRWRPSWRPLLTGLAVASLLAWLLRHAAPGLALGERMDVPVLGGHWWADAAALFSARIWSDGVPSLLAGYALTVALLCSLDTLMAVSVIDGQMRRSRDANRELVAQGLANVASALSGGQACSPSVARSLEMAPRHAAQRHIVLGYAAALAALLWLGPDLLGVLPLSAVGGLLLWQGARLVSPTLWRTPAAWTRFAGTPPSAGQRRLVVANWGIATIVAGTAVALGLGPAVLIGGSFAVLLFVRTNMREVVAAVWTGRTRRSLKVRSPAATEALALAGERIVLYDLEGSLFFGTADALRARLQLLDPRVDSVILDLHQVSEVDVTAARILVEAAEDFAQRGRQLIFSEWPSHDPRRGIVDAVAGPRRRHLLTWSDYADEALEAAEDRLLATLDVGDPDPSNALLPLSRSTLARDLDVQELAWLAAELEEVRFAPGELLFTIGQAGDAIFISLRGDIGLRMPGSTRRLASFAPGVALGEMAVLARSQRSAEAFAETEVLALRLPVDALERLIREHPALGVKLLRNLLLHMGDRLRVVTGDLAQWVSRSASGRAQQSLAGAPQRPGTGAG